MKKIVSLFAAAAMTVSVVFAQDINSVTDTFNNGMMELNMGNKEGALEYLQLALTEAEALGEAGSEIAENCKATIPLLMISIAKDNISEKNYDAASDLLAKAQDAAALYGDEEKAAEAKALENQVLMAQANDLLKAKNYVGAIAVYNEIMAADPDNAMAALRLGQCYAATGDVAKAESALAIAAANGQEKQANKQLSNIYVKKAAASLKAKKTQEAYNYALKSIEYLENGTALKIAGQTAMTLGKTAEGVEYLKKYVEVSPNASDANQMRFNIAATAQKLGDKETAKNYYEQLLGDPKFGAAAKQQFEALNK
mgnify:FL=1